MTVTKSIEARLSTTMQKRRGAKMSLRKRLLTLLWMAACVVFSTAQDKNSSGQSRPDLTGTWERNQSKSKGPHGPLTGSISLTISHKEPELRITRKTISSGQDSISELVYFSDGRGEKNVPPLQTAAVVISTGRPSQDDLKNQKPKEVKSKTKWEGNKLVSRSSTAHEVLGNQFYADLTEKRELSSDGKTLTIVTTFVSGRPGITEVFDRVQ